MKRSHIIGSVGSGKTTMAKKLAKVYDIPHIELDNVVWVRASDGDYKRSQEDRDALLTAFVQKDHWVIEEVHYS